MNEERQPRHYRGSLVFPIILIGLGIIFLLSNIGVLRGDIWGTVINLWPILLIAIGLDGIWRRQGLVGATVMIVLGIVFLLSNLGYLDLNVWATIFRLWPILLVAIGFDVLIGRRSLIASLIGLVVILAILAGALWISGVGIGRGRSVSGMEVSQVLEDVSRANLQISPAAGELNVHALSDSANLVAGQVPDVSGRTVREDYSVSGGTASYRLTNSGVEVVGWPGSNAEWLWDLGLTTQIPLDLDVEMGVGSMRLDLTELQLDDLSVSMGVGSITVNLPGTDDYQAQLESAIGELIVVLPPGAGARIRASAGLAAVDVPAGYSENNDVYTSPNYDTAQTQIDLSVSQAIGRIEIRQ
jgi:hypothetical protein